MEYQALYRKHRPQRFTDIVGQDHVSRTLAREIVDGKIAHAYLFAGPRGTGKTTTARILAKSLNCTSPGPDGEPCNTCASCVAITEGSALDVIELDAASHNKVEDIREIRVNVSTVAAASGAYRVYILDEAHMLSRAAGNALLKTLEEPPEHVVFVLATTEPYKLLDTVRSRSQRFDFHPVAADALIGHLSRIASLEGFEVEDGALALVSRHARGSVRDAMSLLEQVAALGGGKVESTGVARALGLADRDAYDRLLRAIADNDAPAALGLVAELASRGADLRRFISDAIGFLRGVFLAQYAPNLEAVVDESKDVIADWKRHADSIPATDVLRAVDVLAEALVQLRTGREERLVVELALLRITRPEAALDAASVSSRLQRLEERIKRLGDSPAPVPPPPVPEPEQITEPEAPFASIPEAPQAEKEEAASPAADLEPAAGKDDAGPAAVAPAAPAVFDLAQFEQAWPAIVAGVREEAGPRRHALLREAAPGFIEEGKVVLTLPAHKEFHLEQLRADAVLRDLVARLAGEQLGGTVRIEFRAADSDEEPVPAPDPARAPDKEELLPDEEGSEDPSDIFRDLLGGEELD